MKISFDIVCCKKSDYFILGLAIIISLLLVLNMEGQAQIVEVIKKVNKTLKIIDHSDPRELKIENVDTYPNNLICFIKFKIFKKDKKIKSIFGTGCLISPKYVLTAAHNVTTLLEVSKHLQSEEYRIEGYVKQGLHDGKYIKKYTINLDKMKISQPYLSISLNQEVSGQNKAKVKPLDYDYALLQITPLQGEKQEQSKFAPIVAIKEKQADCIDQVSLYGFAYQANKNINKLKGEEHKNSSIFMQNMFGGTDRIVQYTAKNLKYEIPTDKGVSGGPIVVSLTEPSIVGIHKCLAKNVEKQKASNVGVSALLMIQQLNEWGRQLIQKPLVFTKSTLALRSATKIGKTDIFSLLDHNLDPLDMHVINGFDLSSVKKIILSGNRIGEEGVRIFLKRDYPNLQSLFLSQNEIYSLSKLSQEQWSHIKSVKNLSLSVNYLKDLPEGILQVKNIKKLHLTHNAFSSVPEVLLRFPMQNKLVVPICTSELQVDQNNFKGTEQNQAKQALLAKNIQLLLNKFQQ